MVVEEITPTLDVRNLPYKILRQLALLLDYPGERDWKALISELPHGRYSFPPEKINSLELQLQRPGGSPSLSLLTSFGQQLMKVGELITYLEAIDHQEGLLLLKSHEPVSITCHPSSVIKQAGQDIVLNCKATGFPKPLYQWFKNNSIIPHEFSNELHLKGVDQDACGDYFCKVTNSMGSETTMIASVQVTPKIAPIVNSAIGEEPSRHNSVSDNLNGYDEEMIPIHLGQYFMLTCNSDAESYQWYRNGYIIPGARSNSLLFQSFQLADEGHYSCKIIVAGQEILTQLAYLKIVDSPSVMCNKEFATGKLALVIANEEYMFPKSNDVHLVHPVDDARLLQEKLEMIGFKVTCLINLTKKEMEAAIDGFCRLISCAEGMYSLFYFNGHGFEEHGKTYLVPIDATRNWTCDAAISAEYILSKIQQCETTKLDVLLLDVCRTAELGDTASSSTSIPTFKAGAQCVFGYATCPQAQAFEVRQHSNGIYMKHLAEHITKNMQVEQLLHKVNAAVREETEQHYRLSNMSPTYKSMTNKVFSLCDNILPPSFSIGEMDPAVEWFRYHRLPPNQTIRFDHGIIVKIKFLREYSNVCNITLFVEDKGLTSYCDAKILEKMDVPNYSMNREISVPIDEVFSKSLEIDSFSSSVSSQRSSEYERWTTVHGLQKLNKQFKVTVQVEFALDQTASYIREDRRDLIFPVHEFGITSFFSSLARE